MGLVEACVHFGDHSGGLAMQLLAFGDDAGLGVNGILQFDECGGAGADRRLLGACGPGALFRARGNLYGGLGGCGGRYAQHRRDGAQAGCLGLGGNRIGAAYGMRDIGFAFGQCGKQPGMAETLRLDHVIVDDDARAQFGHREQRP